jgi:hypothetical protein
MKKIIKLTESDLTRIVMGIIKEGNYDDLLDPSRSDFSKSDYKPLENFLTVDKKLTHMGSDKGYDFYVLKYPEYHVIVGVKESYEIRMVLFTINVVFKRGEILNFIEYRYGKKGLKLSVSEERKMSRLINESIEFGELNKKKNNV